MEDPTTQTPPKQNVSLPIRGTPEMFDINILPARYRRKRLTLVRVLPWMLLLILLGSIYPTYTMAAKAQQDFLQERLALTRKQVNLDFFQTNNNQLNELQTQLDDAIAERDLILESYGDLDLSPESWNSVLFQIQQVIPEGVALSYLSRQNDAYYLEGISSEYQQVINLSDSLAGIDLLTAVEIESIEQIEEDELNLLLSSPPEEAAEGEEEVVPADLTYWTFTILFHSTGEVQP